MADEGREGDEGLAEDQSESRKTGGDAPAAGSISEREEVAEGDGPFSDDEDEKDEEDADGAPGQDREGGQEAAEPPDEPPG